jgi:predicted MFS family arabinose efflux permease
LIVLYALAYQLQTPLEPFLVERLKTSSGGTASEQYALLQSFFGLIQLVGSLLVGGLIDRLGLRAMFLVNFIACASSYAILASAESMAGLYAAKVPTLFMAGFLCAQTAVSALTAPGAERIAQLGRLTMAYTIGSTVGPALGGFLGATAAARLAVAVSVLAGALVLAMPGLGVPPPPPREAGGGAAAPASPWLSTAAAAVAATWPLLATKGATGLVNAANGSVRTLALKNQFGFTAAELGLVMSTISLGTALASLALGRLTEAAGGEAGVARLCLGGAAAALAGQAALFLLGCGSGGDDGGAGTGVGRTYVALVLGHALFSFPLSATITALTTARVAPGVRGTLVGIEHAVFALAYMVGPVAGVRVQEKAGLGGVALCACAAFTALLLAWARGVPGGGGGTPASGAASPAQRTRNRPGSPGAASTPSTRRRGSTSDPGATLASSRKSGPARVVRRGENGGDDATAKSKSK